MIKKKHPSSPLNSWLHIIKRMISQEGVMDVSDLPEKINAIPNKVIDLIVSNTLSKNGVNLEDVKGKLSAEQKQLLKELVEELTIQVDQFIDQPTSPKKDSE